MKIISFKENCKNFQKNHNLVKAKVVSKNSQSDNITLKWAEVTLPFVYALRFNIDVIVSKFNWAHQKTCLCRK